MSSYISFNIYISPVVVDVSSYIYIYIRVGFDTNCLKSNLFGVAARGVFVFMFYVGTDQFCALDKSDSDANTTKPNACANTQ